MTGRANGYVVEGRVPPHDIEAETSVLGALLLDQQAITKITFLRPEDCYWENNGAVLRASRQLFARGDPIDHVTLAAELESMGLLERVGGRAQLALLQEGVPTAANVVHYATRVRDLSRKRQAIAKGLAIAEAGYDPTLSAEETTAVAQRSALELADYSLDSEPERAGDLIAQFMHRMDEAKGTGMKGIPTGFSGIDLLLRGLKPGDLVIVAGRPGMGKSAFGVQIALNVALNTGPAAIFSLEMSKEQLTDRLVSGRARIDKPRLDTGNLSDDEWERLSAALGPLGDAPLYIDEQRKLDELSLSAKLRNLALSKEIQDQGGLQLGVLDYLQIMSCTRDFRDNQNLKIGYLSQSLKTLAGELRIPLIVMSQLNRAPELRTDKRPILSDLRDSGSLEQDADVVMLLFREDYYQRDPKKCNRKAEVNIAKHRNGAAGLVTLLFDKNQTRFADIHDGDDRELASLFGQEP